MDSSLFEKLDTYQWEDDEEFQHGLNAILSSNPPAEQRDQVVLRARCFYFTRKFDENVDFEAYQKWRSERDSSSATAPQANGISTTSSAKDDDDEEEGRSFSYQEIVEMIQTGKPIPGIKDIPDTVLEGQGTESTKSQRRKPWEKNESEQSQHREEANSQHAHQEAS